jgi:hypothetical protein
MSRERLDGRTIYPQQGLIGAEIVQRSLDTTGREVIRVDTGPWGLESDEGVTQFDILPDLLVDW